MLTEQQKRMYIEQSLRQIELSVEDADGLIHLLLADPGTRAHGQRLQAICNRICDATRNVEHTIEQGLLPASPEQASLGRRVQEATVEISQI
ncbi:hypothetical protein OS242_00450 [Tumebacillus sp. DT12]|uniref:Uncharacterized protein n=1 Tax=Tumebacillus lacus TaxID=2995335 RepID=A0ABT3WUT8_9BACL|nr:hypothetical protein [Tumebacillus lacus]MCX7568442.1 hypothetical protein [Tumebacillus lacus]